jgi:hypothetical protein
VSNRDNQGELLLTTVDHYKGKAAAHQASSRRNVRMPGFGRLFNRCDERVYLAKEAARSRRISCAIPTMGRLELSASRWVKLDTQRR